MKKQIGKSVVAWIMCIIMVLTISNLPMFTAEVEAVEKSTIYNWKNVKIDENEYEAFERIGKEFFDKYIKGKYESTAKQKGNSETVFTLESVYAMEYAMNKDFLSDETVAQITKGDTKLVNLSTYTETLNVFCAEACEQMSISRRSTDAMYSDSVIADDSYEWSSASTIGKGITTPDFSELSFFGYDPMGSNNFYEYVFHYANMGRSGLRGAVVKNDKMYNTDGNLIFGWGQLSDGSIRIQESYMFEPGSLNRLYNTSGYGFVLSDNRYYIVNESILQMNDLTLNFAKDMGLREANWYEDQMVEDRDVSIILDDYYGIQYEDFVNQIGQINSSYMHKTETMGYQKLFYMGDVSLPISVDNEAEERIELSSESSSLINIDCLTNTQIVVNVENDIDGWYKDHVFFTSSNPEVAYVDQTGNVYGITKGSTTITAFVKGAGRCTPLNFTVEVNNSPKISNQVPVGVFSEDAIFLGGNSDVMFDSLTDNMNRNGAAAITFYEQPIFNVNGEIIEDASKELKEEDVLSLERRTQECSTMPFEEYKRLADQLHAQGKKMYIFFQSYYSQNFGDSSNYNTSYIHRMIEKYRDDPTDEEASRFVDKLMNAYATYFEKYGAYYEAVGVDGIYVTEQLGNYNNATYGIDGEKWKVVIDALRENYNGEILAFALDKEDTREQVLNNSIFKYVDGIHVSTGYDLAKLFDTRNPSVTTCKKAIQDKYVPFCDDLYEKYHKPISTEWWISSTDIPSGSHAVLANMTCKGESFDETDSSEHKLSADYLQQMIVWQAIMEVFSEKEYTDIVYSRYAYQLGKIYNSCLDLSSGYDCSPTIYNKPAEMLLNAWSTKRLDRDLTTKVSFNIEAIGEDALKYGFYVMNKDSSATIKLNPEAGNYSFKSKNEAIATVNSSGLIEAKSEGDVVIEVIDNNTFTKQTFTLNVIPTSELLDEILAGTNEYLLKLDAAGYDVTLSTFWNVFELAVRINENVLYDSEMDMLVDNGIFDHSDNAKYSQFVYSLRDYEEVTISTLCLSSNVVYQSQSNEEYIRKFIVKNPYGPNLYMNCDAVATDTDYEMRHKNGDLLFGWGNYGGERPQDLREFSSAHQGMITNAAIQSGDRIYFIKDCLIKDSVAITLDGNEIVIPLEADGGIYISDFKEIVGETYYNALVDGDYINPGTGNYGFMFRMIDLGYPTEKGFDFSCDNVTYDGNQTLSPSVTVNYSKGKVTFLYKKIGETEWSEIAPSAVGKYVVRAEVEANNGYRKQICEKEVQITSIQSQIDNLKAPTNLSVEQKTDTIQLTWDCVIGVERYKVLKRNSLDDEWCVIGYSGLNNYEDKVSACNQYVEFAVCAICFYETSDQSVPISITTENHDFFKSDGTNITTKENCALCTTKNIAYDGLTIAAADADYSGEEQTATISGIDASNYTATGNVKTDAGTYEITLTGKGDYAGTKKINWTINKADPTYTVPTGLEATYGDTLADVTLPVVANGAWSWKVATTTSVGNAGTNTFVAVFTPTDTKNYEVKEEEVSVAVAKATTSIALKDTYAPDKIYNGVALVNPTAEQLDITGANYSDVIFTWYKDSVAEANKITGTPKNAGDYVLVASIAETTNTFASSDTSATITITKATPSYTVPTTLTAKCGDKLSTVTLPSGFEWTSEDVALEAGTDKADGQSVVKVAKFVPEDKTNYNDVEDINISITVTHTKSATSNSNGTHSEKCNACDYEGAAVSCSGGTATCSDKATCSVCEAEYGELDSANHKFTTYTSDQDATCLVDGHKSATCDYGCGNKDTVVDEGSKLGHNYEPTFTWSEDGKTCSVTLICDRVSCTAETDGHSVTHDCTVTSAVKTPATCIAKGTTTYTAKYETYTDTKDVVDIEKVDHTWDTGTVTTVATCKEKGVKTIKCTVQGCTESKTEEIAIDANKHVNTEVLNAKDATCTEKGYTGDTHCKDCDTTIAGTEIAATGHDMTKTVSAKVPATCEKDGKEAVMGCKNCDHTEGGAVIKATGHKWDNGTVTKQPTVTAEGVKTFKCTNTGCNETKTESIAKLPEPKKNEVIEDKTGNDYKVTDPAKKEVTYKAPANKKAKTVTIPASVEINGVTYKVTKIDDKAFKGNTTVTKVVIPSSVTAIGAESFSGCKNLTSVSVPKNVTTIGKNAFKGCAKLTKVTLPSKCTKIGANAFNGCKKMKTITIKSTKLTSKSVSANAFKGLSKNVTIKVPKKQLKAYKKLLKKKGFKGKVKA